EPAMEAAHVEGANLELRHQCKVTRLDELGRSADKLAQLDHGAAVEGAAGEDPTPVEGYRRGEVAARGPFRVVGVCRPRAHGRVPPWLPSGRARVFRWSAPPRCEGDSSLLYQLKKVITKVMPKANSPNTFMMMPASAWSSSMLRPNALVGMLPYAW